MTAAVSAIVIACPDALALGLIAWAAIYNLLAIPVAAGVLYPSLGLLLRPEWAALLMSASTIIVTFNALLLRRLRKETA